MALARVPPAFLLRKLMFETPFVLFALALPVVATGPRTEFLGVALSEEGLWAAWNVVAKATLGLGVTTLIAATTPVAELLVGLDRLRVPRPLTTTAGFMARYLDVVTGEMRRMTIARASRAANDRWLWQARATAASVSALFVRSFERGERVWLAMLARGFTGTMPAPVSRRARPSEWWSAVGVALLFTGVGAAARVTL